MSGWKDAKLSASGYDLGSDDLFLRRIGFSGTLGLPEPQDAAGGAAPGDAKVAPVTSIELLPTNFLNKFGSKDGQVMREQQLTAVSFADNKRLMLVLSNPNFVGVRYVKEAAWTPQHILDYVVEHKFNSLIDAGALIKLDTLAVAERLTSHPKFTGD